MELYKASDLELRLYQCIEKIDKVEHSNLINEVRLCLKDSLQQLREYRQKCEDIQTALNKLVYPQLIIGEWVQNTEVQNQCTNEYIVKLYEYGINVWYLHHDGSWQLCDTHDPVKDKNLIFPDYVTAKLAANRSKMPQWWD